MNPRYEPFVKQVLEQIPNADPAKVKRLLKNMKMTSEYLPMMRFVQYLEGSKVNKVRKKNLLQKMGRECHNRQKK